MTTYSLGIKISLEGTKIGTSGLLPLDPFSLLLLAHHNHLKDDTLSPQILLPFCQSKSAPQKGSIKLLFCVVLVQVFRSYWMNYVAMFGVLSEGQKNINICLI